MCEVCPLQDQARRLFAIGVFVLTVFLFSGSDHVRGLFSASAQDPRLQRSERLERLFDTLIARAETRGSVLVIVGVRAPFTPEGELPNEEAVQFQRAVIARAQEAMLRRLPELRSDSVKQFESIPYVALEIDTHGLQALRNSSETISIEDDRVVAPTLQESTAVIGAQNAWAAGSSGQGQTVAILDTGVDKTHSFLQQAGSTKVVSEACFSTTSDTLKSLCPGGISESFSAGSGLNCPFGGCDHGTHVAGIAAGRSAHSSGIARDASLISIQIFSEQTDAAQCGNGQARCPRAPFSDLIRGLEHVAQLRSRFNIAAVNIEREWRPLRVAL